MDFTLLINQTYDRDLQDLRSIWFRLQQAPRNQKQHLKQEFSDRSERLLNSVFESYPSRLACHRVLTVLYQKVASFMGDDLAKELRSEWQKKVIADQSADNLDVKNWNLSKIFEEIACPQPRLKLLPLGSWFIQVKFELAKPYISRDDVPSYIIDNPICKDRVLGLPIVRPSSWKGNLRTVLRQIKSWTDTQPEMTRLFGNSKDETQDFRSGRLEFYPTFFYRIGLEIINPHDRARKVGKNPILFECVPAGAQGTFSLLYVPFDLLGRATPEHIVKEARQDLELVAEALSAMLLTYGFSAKRTSGYGTAKDEIVEGVIVVKAGEHSLKGKKLSQLAQEVKNVAFEPTDSRR